MAKITLKKIWQQYNNLGLQRKILTICLLALGVMTAFCLLAVRITVKIYDTKLYESSLLELEYFSNLVKDKMDDVEKLTFEIAMDREFQRQLSDICRGKETQLAWNAMTSLRDKMSVESVEDDTIAMIVYDNKAGIHYEINNSSVEIPNDLYAQLLENTQLAEGAYVYMQPTAEFPYVLSGRDIRERLDASLAYLGTLVVAYDVKGIIEENINTLSGVENNLCVAVDDRIVYTNNEILFQEVPQLAKNSGYEIVNKDGIKYFRTYLKAKDTGWLFINECTYDSIYQTTRMTNQIIIVLLLILFAGVAALLHRVCVIFTMPLTNLAESMKIVEEGNFERAKEMLLPVQSMDEVGVLSEEFEIMLDKIEMLIKENYEKQITLMDTRYKALQAQINPHFLYNTLNSIGWTIKAGRNEEAQKMITALGSQLRAAFREDPYTTLEEELKLLKHYVYIQQIRYYERVEFVVEAEENLMDVKVPLLSLQPLVENAIDYGVENSLKKCTIKVKVYRAEDKVRIEVEDNGAGMSRERLEAVRSLTMQPRKNGIGLKNINQRLELLYGDRYRMQIDSEEGSGTTIIIELGCLHV